MADIKETVAEQLKQSGARVADQVVNLLVQEELEKRTKAASGD